MENNWGGVEISGVEIANFWLTMRRIFVMRLTKWRQLGG